jgi:hypothetical protein
MNVKEIIPIAVPLANIVLFSTLLHLSASLNEVPVKRGCKLIIGLSLLFLIVHLCVKFILK